MSGDDPIPVVSLRGAALGAAGVAVLVYLNSLANGFALDDLHIVVENPAVRSPAAALDAFWSPYWPGPDAAALGLWRPLTTLVLSFAWMVGGGSAVPFHVLNVLLHAGASALVVVLLARLLPAGVAALAGLVFAVHPVHTEAVANVVGLGELLACVAVLAACILWVRGSDAFEDAGARAGAFAVPGTTRLAGVLALYLMAVLAKEGAIVLPLLLVLLDGARRPRTLRSLPVYLGRRWASFTLLAGAGAALLAARFVVLGSVAAPLPPLGAHLLSEAPRIWTAAETWIHYPRLLLLPARLAADYAPPTIAVTTVPTPAGLAGIFATLAALGAAMFTWRRGSGLDSPRVVAFAVAWVAFSVLPVANLLFLSGVLLAERTLYLPSVGAAAGVAWLLHRVVRARRRVGLAVAVMVLVAAGVRSVARNPSWGSTESVLTRLIRDYPESGRAQWALGDLLWSTGERAAAKRAYARALDRLDLNYRLTVVVAGRLASSGSDLQAERLLRLAIERRGDVPNATELLAAIHEGRGDSAGTERWARLSTVIAPERPVGWHLLAGALEAQGRIRDAIVAREAVIERGEGGAWQQWLSLARLRRMVGDAEGAGRALDRARELAGSDVLRDRVDSAFSAAVPPGDRAPSQTGGR